MSETVNRKVIDVSHHNDPVDFAAVRGAGIVGVIHKATQGTSFVDDQYKPRAVEAVKHGLVFGAYHFGTIDNVQQQVDHFLSVAGMSNEMLYALDWETDQDGQTMSQLQARAFVERLEDKIGKNRCVIYSGNIAKEYIKGKDKFWGAHRLWLAHYSSSPTCQQSWDKYWLWQYSDGVNGPGPHGCPGVNGDCDTNSFAGSDVNLRMQWSAATPAPKPPPDVASVEIITRGQVRIVVNGRLVSIPDQGRGQGNADA